MGLRDDKLLATLRDSAVFSLGENLAKSVHKNSIWRQDKTTRVCAPNAGSMNDIVYYDEDYNLLECDKDEYSDDSGCEAWEKVQQPKAVHGHWPRRQECKRNFILIVLSFVVCAALALTLSPYVIYLIHSWRILFRNTRKLLERTLPKHIASVLVAIYASMRTGNGEPFSKPIDNAAVLFLDIEGFTQACNSYMNDPTAIVSALNHFFGELDDICALCGCIKVKTVGDQYMAARCAPAK